MPNIKIVSHLVGNVGKYATCYFMRYVPHACHFHWYTQVKSSSAATLITVKQAADVPDCVRCLIRPSFSDAPPPQEKEVQGAQVW